ncbi:hypothetical protein Csa_004866 [Cucumis sativus]|nr:hypothetical protein Csa_004866 [Cucumis sativus]
MGIHHISSQAIICPPFGPSTSYPSFSSFGFSISSTAGVSQTVAALYTGQKPSIKDTMSVVVKVWKRLLRHESLCYSVVLQLAGVVSALEESRGFKAMAKSRLLLKENMVSATVIVLAISSGFGILLWLKSLTRMMLFSPPSVAIWMHLLASLSLDLLVLVFLLWSLVSETMFYFVCKSYNHESIDMSTVSDHDPILLENPRVLILSICM